MVLCHKAVALITNVLHAKLGSLRGDLIWPISVRISVRLGP